MTKKASRKGSVKKLKVKKETLKDLDAKGKEKAVKGGYWNPSPSAPCSMSCGVTCGCPEITHWYRAC